RRADRAVRTVGRDQGGTGELLDRAGLAIPDLEDGGAIAGVAAGDQARRLGAETDVDRAAGTDRVEQDLLDQILRRHQGQRWAHVRAGPLEAARLDLAELPPHSTLEKADRALPSWWRVDAA